MIFSFALTLMTAAGVRGNFGTARAQIDARRLQTGEFIYRDSAKGQVLGESSISIRFGGHDASYHFSAQTAGYADQRWESVASATLTPKLAQLSFGKGPDQPTASQLDYTGDKVTGFILSGRSPEARSPLSVNASIDSDTVDQRIDWVAAMALNLRHASRFGFKVYDATTGSSEVLVRVSPRGRIAVPAGTFRYSLSPIGSKKRPMPSDTLSMQLKSYRALWSARIFPTELSASWSRGSNTRYKIEEFTTYRGQEKC